MDNDLDVEEFMKESVVPFPTAVFGHPVFDGNDPGPVDILKDRIDQVRKEANEWKEWALLEIQHWRDRCAELETELVIVQGDFERELNNNAHNVMVDLNPKKYNKNWRE